MGVESERRPCATCTAVFMKYTTTTTTTTTSNNNSNTVVFILPRRYSTLCIIFNEVATYLVVLVYERVNRHKHKQVSTTTVTHSLTQ